MTAVERVVPAGAAEVFAVLADGWSYGAWVVGNSHVRDVDPRWPEVGTRLHHRSGAWPVQVNDITVVRAVEKDRFLRLAARLWPLGQAEIALELHPAAGGTRVVLTEVVTDGPLKIVPDPVQAVLFKPRNTEALARLSDLVQGRGAARSH
ncbi:SRPBCC family protein [Amycolatopsis minnesotensis]|uniref:SRPBCC family protein n=1 Tax=Amycolatopsis minnesotensis TaxID=337894 RepID=A0ABN2QWJ6_9PSEU